MKTSLLENRPLAFIVLVAAVIISIFGIGGARLSGIAKEADNYFTDNISGDLNTRASTAQTLLDLTQDSIGTTAAYKSAQSALADFEKAEKSGEAGDIYDANQKLTSTFEALFNTYKDEKGATYAGDAVQDNIQTMRSSQNYIDGSPTLEDANVKVIDKYNELARDVQQETSGFPAGLIAALTGARVEEFA